MEDFSYSRDLLRRFGGGKTEPTEAAGGDLGEVELSLGLSLGGCFGGEPKEKGLVRSSSVSVSAFPQTCARGEGGAIGRTWSLPAEGEEEWRRRKEMQCRKRMEAKRKREAKCPAPRWGAGAGMPPASQVSIGSSGSSSSSGVLDSENKPLHGVDATTALNGSVEVKSPSVSVKHANKKALSSPMLSKTTTNAPKEEDEPSKKRTRTRSNGMERSMTEEMPCVSTRGDGPDGRRIEGFLYKYRKGEEVRIVCVCHGSFLTPAEFVKHAGGGDVDHPLRHIVVNRNPSVLL